MLLISILFTVLTSHICESFIMESINIQAQNEHQRMIEKMQRKYNITGGAKKYLNLLGDSVYTESLEKELKFTKLLPTNMYTTVVDVIYNIYYNKFEILQGENIAFFEKFMIKAKFRKCIYGE